MSISKLWEPLAEVLFNTTSKFQSGEIVAIEFCDWSHGHLKYSPTLMVGKADLEFASGASIPIFTVRMSGPTEVPNLIDPTELAFSDETEWSHMIMPVDPDSLYAEVTAALGTFTNRYRLGREAKFYVDESDSLENDLLESGLFVEYEGGKFSPVKPEVLRREPRFRIELD